MNIILRQSNIRVFRFFLFLTILFGNAWIWRISQFNFLIFSLVVSLSAFFLFYSIDLKYKSKKWTLLIIVLSFMVLFLQKNTTEFESLTLLSNDEQRVHDRRVEFYNPSSHWVRLFFYRTDMVNLLEGDLGTALTRIQRNLFETLDFNVYFFGGFPRQRVEVSEFEKFPFVLIVPFLIGCYQIISKKNWLLISYTLVDVVLLSFIGHKNMLGSFMLLPFFVTSIYLGIIFLFKFVKKFPKNSRLIIVASFCLLFLLSLILNFNYAIF